MENEKKGQKNTSLVTEKSTALVVGEKAGQAVEKNQAGENNSGILTREEFHELAAVPAAAEWFANIQNPRTRRAYQTDLTEFMAFVGISGYNPTKVEFSP